MMGIEPSDDMKKEIVDMSFNIIERIIKDNREDEAVKIINSMVLTNNN